VESAFRRTRIKSRALGVSSSARPVLMPRIFISYRRDDAAGDAGRLADHLHRRFGASHVFLDIDTIDAGTDFVQVLQDSLQQTAAMLVVIGRHWTSLLGADGVRRLDDPNDFVRREVETALGRKIPVVPVLVQGAPLPRKEDLPEALAGLVTRQAAKLDHAEFHDDCERLCDRLAPLILNGSSDRTSLLRRWWPAAAVVATLAVGGAAYYFLTQTAPSTGQNDRRADSSSEAGTPPEIGAGRSGGRGTTDPAAIEAMLGEATLQRRRDQFAEALATLARAREAAPASDTVRRMLEDVAMEWSRSGRVEAGKSSFGEVLKPALAVVDAALPSSAGERRADLLAHSGWAAFLLWRDGNRKLDPAEWYRDAMAVDPGNPYANAMLAHWILLREDDMPRAVKLFETALGAGRAVEAVRTLQWAGYANTQTPEADGARVRLADDMRRRGERLNVAQAQALWPRYSFSLPAGRAEDRQRLLNALPPDDHISTLRWAFSDYAAQDEFRRRTIRYYEALLHARAGRVGQAVADLRALDKELAQAPGSLQDAVQAALERLQSGRRGRAER
jgi:hypothetical protein